MKVMWKAACAAVLIAATFIEIGCGNTYRPIATPLPVTTGNPSGAETEVVLNQCPVGLACTSGSSVLTNINVSGDSNAGNKVVANLATSLAFDFNRTTVFTTNTSTDSVTQVLLLPSTAGFAANATTIALDPGSAPIGMSFQYFGTTYTIDYVVNSGTTTATCPGVGSVGAIVQASAELKANICVGKTPVFAWIYKDQSKVFVLDKSENQVYVVSASKFKVTNTIPVGAAPIKATQSADGNFIFVLDSGDGTISIIDALAEQVVGTVSIFNALSSALPIDIAQDLQFNDTTKNLQYNHFWILQADGTVSVFDATNVAVATAATDRLAWITSLATGPNPTNLALMRDGTQAYVGLAGTDKIVAINAVNLSRGAITTNATTAITVGVHRSINQTFKDTTGAPHTVLVETTTPTVNYVAVSRGGNSADLSKAYATTTTNTTYNYYDTNVNPAAPPSIAAGCSAVGVNGMSCPNLYNGTAVVTAVGNGTVPINTYVTTVPAPSVVTYCDPGNPATGEYDGQKNCPAMTPMLVLGRS
jgi:hypothetical protein